MGIIGLWAMVVSGKLASKTNLGLMETQELPSFHIGNLLINGDLILAPIDGYTDSPFRSIARLNGSAMSFTEFINALDVVNGHPRLAQRIQFDTAERPVAFQLLDNDPDRLLEAALKLRVFQPDLFDINLGCPARSVVGRGAGAGLMRTPDKVARIFNMISRAIDLPITAKIRLGWDQNTINFLEIARIVEDNGGTMITLHARTQQQAYNGMADWDAIARVKQLVSIPVIGNGDIRSIDDLDKMKTHTGCDGIMIGRGAIGNPWIFSRIDRHKLSGEQIFGTMRLHLERMTAYYGEKFGLMFFRKHATRYLAPYKIARELYLPLITSLGQEEFLVRLKDLLEAPTI
jgi:tRNA-dihydrouridine synthase B